MEKNRKLFIILFVIISIWCTILTISSVKKNTDTEKSINVNEINVNGISTDFTKIVNEKKESIVTISAGGAISTGFVYKQEDETIYIVTSYHGIVSSNTYNVYFANNLSLNAELVGFDQKLDIALLKVESPYLVNTLDFTDASICNTGEFVICIGTPVSIEYKQSVELGIISGKIKTIENSITLNSNKINYLLDVIQISSNLKPGYSGSPVLNMNGEVIGIITMSYDNDFVFAVTSNEAKIVIDKLIDDNTIDKLNFGIKGTYIKDMPMFERSNLNLKVDYTYGLYVDSILYEDIKDINQLKKGDIILSINDVKLNSINDYLNIEYSNNDSYKFEVLRNDEIITFTIAIND